jgi:superfamily II DNA/RNA helicase
MFDNGFYDDCAYLKRRASKDAQIILSSATITDKVEDFIESEIVDYELLIIGELIPEKIMQEKIYCEKQEKNNILINLLSKNKFKRAIIFCNTKSKSYNIAEFLTVNKILAKSLNSNLEQTERLNHLNLFKDGKLKVLVATDVAARGLHIEQVDIIINYDVPTRDEFYVHRIGRTGRTNSNGYSLTLICPEDVERFDLIERKYKLNVKEISKDFY